MPLAEMPQQRYEYAHGNGQGKDQGSHGRFSGSHMQLRKFNYRRHRDQIDDAQQKIPHGCADIKTTAKRKMNFIPDTIPEIHCFFSITKNRQT